MTLNVNVDEADIGTVQAGQDATFTVDAYPKRVFRSRVIDLRSTPKTVSGVVTYETILSVDNSELLLRPGMMFELLRASGPILPNSRMRRSWKGRR